MDEQPKVLVARRRRSWAEAGQLVAEYESSGLNQREFCESRSLSLATLARYRKRMRETGGEASGGKWIAVEVSRAHGGASGAGSGLSVVLGRGRKIEVGRGFDAPALVQLLNVLERF